MADDIVQEKAGLRYRLMDPETFKTRVDGGGVRFTVQIEDAVTGTMLFKVFGFRLIGGKLYPPARKVGYSWYSQAEISSVAKKVLEGRLKEWKADFPKVRFESDE